MRSIINNSAACYICGRPASEIHHCIFGTGKRKLADEDGLTVPLCSSCHHAIHNPANNFDQSMQNALKKLAEEAWEQKYGSKDDFIKRYGRSYL